MNGLIKKIGFFVILAFVVRVASIFIIKLLINDPCSPCFYRSEHYIIALNILSGNGYVYPYLNTIYYSYGYPLYVYFLAIFHLIFNKNYLILQILQAAIAAFSVIPLFFIAKKIFNEKVAFISGLLYCLHPGFIVHNTVTISEFTLVVCFILVITYLMVCFENKTWNLIAIGILMGLGVLLRPTVVFLIPAFFIYLIVKNEGLKKAFFNLFIIVLLAAVIISPWIYRGYKIYNRFILINTTSAEHFWLGNNPVASGTRLTKEGEPILSAAGEDFRKKLFFLNEIEQYQFFMDEATKYIKTHPVDFLKLTVKKFIYFWSFSPQTGLLYPASWLIIYKILYYFLTFFFILGIYFILKNKHYVNVPIIIFLFSFFIMISLAHSFYHLETRHRWMIESLIMIISSYGIANIFFKK